ncbi:MAG TPA: hypothetical protein VHD85_09280 [Terracidiphilus sp.]|jgi:hypothetical protein|nr:hypothetical protein [Terracidiphilus sp.]
MMRLALAFFSDPDLSNLGLWMFLSIGAVSLFGIFIPLVSWIDSRRKEREAFYKAETMRRLAESSTEGAKMALDMLNAENRLGRLKSREGLKVGGLINIGVGVGLIIFLRSLIGPGGPYLCGLIPLLIGVAMLAYVYALAAPVE